MGLLACFANPTVNSQTNCQLRSLTKDLSEARAQVARLQGELQQIKAGQAQPHDPATSERDAAIDLPCTSVAVQTKPTVMLESRIPQPGNGDQPLTRSAAALPEREAGLRSRIPAHPAESSAKGDSNRSTKEAVCGSPTACSTGLICAIGAKASQEAQHASATNLSTLAAAATSQNLIETAGFEQRNVLLQQQLKVADAFRTSLEAQLRDARFANSSLQTQVLNLQTRFEQTIEEQVAELERLSGLRKEGQDRYDAVAFELAELKRLHENSSTGQLAAYQDEASAAVKRAIDSELKLSQVTSQLQLTQEELQNTEARLHSTEQLVQHMAAQAKSTTEQYEEGIVKLQNELKSQKAIYDSTVEELLQLSNNHNNLKQDYHRLQSETRNNDEVVQLVQQELAELSYYAAAGRVALGVTPEACTRSFSTAEVSLPPHGRSSSSDTHVSSLKLSITLADSRQPAAALAGRNMAENTLAARPHTVVPVDQEEAAEEDAVGQ